MAGKRCTTDINVKQTVTPWLQTLDTVSVCIRIQALTSRWGKCSNFHGDYMKVWSVPSAAHVPCTHRSHNKVLGIGEVHTLFLQTTFYSPILQYDTKTRSMIWDKCDKTETRDPAITVTLSWDWRTGPHTITETLLSPCWQTAVMVLTYNLSSVLTLTVTNFLTRKNITRN